MVFSQDGVLHPEQTVLDRPAVTPESEQLFRTGRLDRAAGDRICNRRFGFAFDRCLAFELQKLTQAGPVTGVRSDCRDRQCATFDPTTTLLDRGCRASCFKRLAFGIGGPVLSLKTGPSGITKA